MSTCGQGDGRNASPTAGARVAHKQSDTCPCLFVVKAASGECYIFVQFAIGNSYAHHQLAQHRRLPQCFVILPIASGGVARRVGFALPISGIKTMGIVRCEPRVPGLNASSSGHQVDALPAAMMNEVLGHDVRAGQGPPLFSGIFDGKNVGEHIDQSA